MSPLETLLTLGDPRIEDRESDTDCLTVNPEGLLAVGTFIEFDQNHITVEVSDGDAENPKSVSDFELSLSGNGLVMEREEAISLRVPIGFRSARHYKRH